MYQWRVTKYNPALRDENGWFIPDDWIIVQQIGETHEGQLLTRDVYLETEDKYVAAALSFFQHSGLKTLQVKEFGVNPVLSELPDHILSNDLAIDMELHEGQELNAEEIAIVLRMLLREITWCKLVSKDRFFIHIGWDYYMFIGSRDASSEAIKHAENLGLYVEEFESPY